MEQKLIKAVNVETGETVEFASQKEAAEYFSKIYGKRIPNSSIRKMLEQKPLYKNTWKVRYIGDGKITKKCDHCGKEFKTRRKQQRFCNGVCREDYYAEQALPTKTAKEKALIHKLYVMLTPLRTAK